MSSNGLTCLVDKTLLIPLIQDKHLRDEVTSDFLLCSSKILFTFIWKQWNLIRLNYDTCSRTHVLKQNCVCHVVT